MDVRVKFLGAAKTVTGSRYLLDIGEFRVLFDCGLFQGLKELRQRNWEPCPVEPSSIHAVVISHGHIDHTGYLPRLVREGFKGPVYCTKPTADLLELLLLDSAKLQEEEALYAAKKGYSRHGNPEPLYYTSDAQQVFPLVKKFDFGLEIPLHEKVSIKFHAAGHMLGAAITEMFIKGNGQQKTIVFSGDLGRNSDAVLPPPEKIKKADVLFIESTYGHKDNKASDAGEELGRIVNQTFRNGGVLLIPAFAVGRTQTLLYHFHDLMERDIIPDVPVYVDSPMATSATYLYYKHPAYHNAVFNRTEFARQMETNLMVFVKTSQHSKSLNNIKTNAIIISSSGMMTGGRVLHHMYHRLPNPQDTLLVAGYQAEGTRGRDLVDRKPTIKIFGEAVPVRCHVENMSGFSGHADRGELFEWMGGFQEKPKITFVVHGENPGMQAYAEEIRLRLGWNVIQPDYLDTVQLFNGI
jgi:metallo-beta-lactamase family protein